MPPPSRGRWKDGALAPSTSFEVFSTDELLLRGFAEGAGAGDFNRFDAALCDVWRFSLDAFAARPAFTTFVLDAFDDFATGRPLGEVLGDFLRDFLDIRLPFVAFGGSIIRVLRTLAAAADSGPWLGKSDGLGVCLQGIRRDPVCSLSELFPPDDEQQD
jgi:hypothetical protein